MSITCACAQPIGRLLAGMGSALVSIQGITQLLHASDPLHSRGETHPTAPHGTHRQRTPSLLGALTLLPRHPGELMFAATQNQEDRRVASPAQDAGCRRWEGR